MPSLTPSATESLTMHSFYLSMRELALSNTVPFLAVQRGFEAVMAGFLGIYTWRSTHITIAAANKIVEGNANEVQRAHGIGGRLGRYDRTLRLLTGSQLSFDEWWNFYIEHDKTVLITRDEHNSNQVFDLNSLIPLPHYSANMFFDGGFSFKARKKIEVKWLIETLNKKSKT